MSRLCLHLQMKSTVFDMSILVCTVTRNKATIDRFLREETSFITSLKVQSQRFHDFRWLLKLGFEIQENFRSFQIFILENAILNALYVGNGEGCHMHHTIHTFFVLQIFADETTKICLNWLRNKFFSQDFQDECDLCSHQQNKFEIMIGANICMV